MNGRKKKTLRCASTQSMHVLDRSGCFREGTFCYESYVSYLLDVRTTHIIIFSKRSQPVMQRPRSKIEDKNPQHQLLTNKKVIKDIVIDTLAILSTKEQHIIIIIIIIKNTTILFVSKVSLRVLGNHANILWQEDLLWK